ncbi:TadG family pilus assembly protein [Methylobacterium sp. NEAU 140]|uniref:pilus assembly protein TadG-related protein n=1 Tax=Methylobacterium sp. NEAU 140 TaxID=3064945 RepID=UPI0027353D89|nr:pilus assembly protein TadG-related protein [Methylobacterium sp. NEAU 140]MDP4025557.1 TadG family pilus assembly protein [Methylobacterium sp. NEAU 140]
MDAVARVRALGRLGRDRRGSVAVLVALGAMLLMGAATVGLDLGTVALARRKAQGAVDLAALSAAARFAQAEPRARLSLADNGYAAGNAVTVATGAYAGDAEVAPADRFKAGAAPGNAVRVALQTSVRTHFAQAVGLPPVVPIRVTATAAQAQFASFTLGSGTAALNGGLLNAVLGGMLGAKLSLGVLDYNAILSARVDILRVFDALSTTLGVEVGDYNRLLKMNASVGQIISALRVAMQGETNAAPAVNALGTLLGNLTGSSAAAAPVPIAQVADLGDAAALTPGSNAAGPKAGLFDLIADAASLANGQRQVAIDLGTSVAGLLSARITLAVGERRQSSGWAQPGSAAATLHTAQTRLLVEVGITAPLNLGSITLPVYAEIAPARATLRSVTCPSTDPSQRRVTVEAQPGLLNLAIADVPRSAIAVGAATPDLTRGAALISLLSISVRGQARVSIAPPAPQLLTFTDADITRLTPRSASTTGLTGSLTGSLIQNLTLSLDSQDLVLLTLLKPLLLPAIQLATGPLDGILDTLLRILGIRVGYAEVTVDGTRCDQAVLVQ